jgi:hypothetical protein
MKTEAEMLLGTEAQGNRQSRPQRGERCHHDRTKPDETGLHN